MSHRRFRFRVGSDVSRATDTTAPSIVANELTDALRGHGFDVSSAGSVEEVGSAGAVEVAVGNGSPADVRFVLDEADLEHPPGSRLTVCSSEGLARRFDERHGGEDPILVARPPLPSSWLAPHADPSQTPGHPRFVHLDDAANSYGPLVVEAFRSVPNEHATLTVLHDHADGPPARVSPDGRIRWQHVQPESRATIFAQATATVVTSTSDAVDLAALQAQQCGSPLIVLTGGGSGRELVDHGVVGLVCEPDAGSIAWAMQHLAENAHVRWSHSLLGRRRASAVTWDRLISHLVRTTEERPRPSLLALNTFGAHIPVNGGQRRLKHTLAGLGRHADVELVVLSAETDRPRRRWLTPGVVQIDVPRSEDQLAAEERIHEIMGFPTDDVTAARLSALTPAWQRAVDAGLRQADAIVVNHPFLAPCVDGASVPIVHSSYNVEAELKRDSLPAGPDGEWLQRETERCERIAVRQADHIIACTARDLAVLRAEAEEAGRRPAPPGTVVPNGVDTRALSVPTAQQRARFRAEVLHHAGLAGSDTRPIAVFIGSWHGPNIEAADLLVEVAVERPGWIFVLAGSHTSELAERDEPVPPNARLIPTFDEGLLQPLLAGADVVVNPMRTGGGSNLKIFDYLAVGTPVLSTPVGVRGIDDPERYVALSDPDAPSLASALDAIVDEANSASVAMRSELGRAFVEEVASWTSLGSQWAGAVLSVLGGENTEATHAPDRAPTPLVVAASPPPSADETIAAIETIGVRAMTRVPPPQEHRMDPVLREALAVATQNHKVGRELPDDARLAPAKKGLIRVGHAFTNEQLNFNVAALEALGRTAELIGELQALNGELASRLGDTEAELAELRRQVHEGGGPDRSHESNPSTPPDPQFDRFYASLEDDLRGDEEAVTELVRPHLARLVGAEITSGVLDFGCGRGEWLQLLAQHGIEARGVDTSQEAVTRARRRGLDAVCEDGFAHLAELAPGSLHAITSFHVIEHLDARERARFVHLAHRALAPDGLLLVETPNCLNLQVGATSFWLDPTHLAPVHPHQLRALFEHVGFVDVETRGLHPDDPEHPTSLAPDPATNGILVALHELLFTSNDVAVSGRKSPR